MVTCEPNVSPQGNTITLPRIVKSLPVIDMECGQVSDRFSKLFATSELSFPDFGSKTAVSKERLERILREWIIVVGASWSELTQLKGRVGADLESVLWRLASGVGRVVMGSC
ncbi:hypothetical protein ACFE04_023710 [Oxalis oulophora]